MMIFIIIVLGLLAYATVGVILTIACSKIERVIIEQPYMHILALTKQYNDVSTLSIGVMVLLWPLSSVYVTFISLSFVIGNVVVKLIKNKQND